MMNRYALAALSLAALFAAPLTSRAQCFGDECVAPVAPSGPTQGSELAALESSILDPLPEIPEVPQEDVPEPAEQPLTLPRAAIPSLFLQLRQYAGTGINRGSLYVTTLDMGISFPLGTPYLGIQTGLSIGFGSYRDVTLRTSSAYLELGFFADTIVRLNPSDPVTVFAVAGARFSLGGPLVHEVAPGEEEGECPSLTTVEASFGLGGEFSWGRHGLVSMSVRGVRRRATGELEFAANGENPPVTATRGTWGVAATIQLGARFH